MRSFLAVITVVFLSLLGFVCAADEIRGETRVEIPTNTSFGTSIPSPEGVTWVVDIDLDARLRYAGLMNEAIGNFATKMTMNSITSSKALTYTDKETGQTVTAPTVFRPSDPIIDELGARRQFNEIKLLKAYFLVSLGGDTVNGYLQHIFMDTEVFARSGEWGFEATSTFDWKVFCLAGLGTGFDNAWERRQANSHSPDLLKKVKGAYVSALKHRRMPPVTLLTNPKPELTGLYEFENAIMAGLRKKVEKKKPAVSADDLKQAFGGKNKEKEEEPEKPKVSAADLRKAFGGTAVPINEMDKTASKPGVTAADLRMAFAKAQEREPEKPAAFLKPEPKETKVTLEDLLGPPLPYESCKFEHSHNPPKGIYWHHNVWIQNNYKDGRIIAVKLFSPDNKLLRETKIKPGEIEEIGLVTDRYNLNSEGNSRAFYVYPPQHCHNYKVQIESMPTKLIKDLNLKKDVISMYGFESTYAIAAWSISEGGVTQIKPHYWADN